MNTLDKVYKALALLDEAKVATPGRGPLLSTAILELESAATALMVELEKEWEYGYIAPWRDDNYMCTTPRTPDNWHGRSVRSTDAEGKVIGRCTTGR